MTTFDDDSMRLHMGISSPLVPIKKFGFEWPPPERIYMAEHGVLREALPEDEDSYVMVRVRYSAITDEQRAKMTHVFRGAEYYYESEAEDQVES